MNPSDNDFEQDATISSSDGQDESSEEIDLNDETDENPEQVYELSLDEAADADALIRESIAKLAQANNLKASLAKLKHEAALDADEDSDHVALEEEHPDDAEVSPGSSTEAAESRLNRMTKNQVIRLLKEAYKRLKDAENRNANLRLAYSHLQHELNWQLEREANLLEHATQLTEKLKGVEEIEASLRRLKEEFPKFQTRLERERNSQIKNANRELIKRLLSVLDSFDSAFAVIRDGNDHFDAIQLGMERIFKQLTDILYAHGLRPIDAKGQQFNPQVHEAMLVRELTDLPDKHISDELRKGYLFFEQVLRPALVSVVKNPLQRKREAEDGSEQPNPDDVQVTPAETLQTDGVSVKGDPPQTVGENQGFQTAPPVQQRLEANALEDSVWREDQPGDSASDGLAAERPLKEAGAEDCAQEVKIGDSEQTGFSAESVVKNNANHKGSGDQNPSRTPHSAEFDPGTTKLL